MSTTRWIIWWCDPIWGADAETHCTPNDAYHLNHCGFPVLVDPANLPPEAIERAAAAEYEVDAFRWSTGVPIAWDHEVDEVKAAYRETASAAIAAFLSDPEPGDQT